MSFSSLVKNELCRVEHVENCCLISELGAIVRISGTVKTLADSGCNIKIVTENAAFARKIFSVIKKLYNVYPEVMARKSKKLKKHNLYILVITPAMGSEQLMGDVSAGIGRKICCKKAYLRGAFLSGGSVSDPEKTYHLEIINHNKKLAAETCELMNSFHLHAKIIRRKGTYVTYLKEGENIVDFLNIVGAHKALLELENVRILKEMRNNVNRIVNCETANLDKTVNASLRQVDNIKYIQDFVGFDNLPPSLREIAELRIQFSDANLKELGEKLNPPLGKSGVNHRLRKLDEIAANVRNSKGEF